MATPRQTKKKSLVMFLALLVAVIIVVVASVLVQKWWNDRPTKDPADVTVRAEVRPNGEKTDDPVTLDYGPYVVCEPGTTCPDNPVPALKVGENDVLHLEIPKEVYDHDWSLLMIYDDPAANQDQYFAANQTKKVDIPGSTDPVVKDSDERPKLVVVEINTLMVGLDDQGEETPYAVVWSLNTQGEHAIPDQPANQEDSPQN